MLLQEEPCHILQQQVTCDIVGKIPKKKSSNDYPSMSFDKPLRVDETTNCSGSDSLALPRWKKSPSIQTHVNSNDSMSSMTQPNPSRSPSLTSLEGCKMGNLARWKKTSRTDSGSEPKASSGCLPSLRSSEGNALAKLATWKKHPVTPSDDSSHFIHSNNPCSDKCIHTACLSFLPSESKELPKWKKHASTSKAVTTDSESRNPSKIHSFPTGVGYDKKNSCGVDSANLDSPSLPSGILTETKEMLISNGIPKLPNWKKKGMVPKTVRFEPITAFDSNHSLETKNNSVVGSVNSNSPCMPTESTETFTGPPISNEIPKLPNWKKKGMLSKTVRFEPITAFDSNYSLETNVRVAACQHESRKLHCQVTDLPKWKKASSGMSVCGISEDAPRSDYSEPTVDNGTFHSSSTFTKDNATSSTNRIEHSDAMKTTVTSTPAITSISRLPKWRKN